ncbi:GVQW3 [Cordylochernes scorpioides]|uniref:GVQW3 n=1 Tax=Cordylochernes scorpioides TaxID=51811 RepID=A0ABY6KZR1_9ARAC|nr:GVQW3 [Cordylochernes scorpioides]
MSSGTAVPTTRGPMGRLSIIPGHQGGEGFAESGRRGELRSLIRINSVLGIQMVRRWRSWFLEGRQSVHDDERSGRPVTATVNAAVAAVRNVVEADRRITID